MHYGKRLYLKFINQNLNTLIVNQIKIYVKLQELINKVEKLENDLSDITKHKDR